MKTIYLTTILLVLSVAVNAQFEGKIEFLKITPKDTTKYIYYVKGDKVRIDNLVNKTVKGSSIIDLKTKDSYKALSPTRKMWMVVKTKKSVKDYSATKLTKTKDVKKLKGYECEKWIVTNKDFGTTTTYWMAKGKFDFFEPLIQVVKRKENLSQYLLNVGDLPPYFPIEGYETKGKVRIQQLRTTKITEEKISDSVFAIPAGYKKFEN